MTGRVGLRVAVTSIAAFHALRRRPSLGVHRYCWCRGGAGQHWGARGASDPAAGSPTAALLRLLLPPDGTARGASCGALRTARQTAQSVGATGGVYKGQGRNRRPVVAGAYGTFLVRGGQLQAPVPTTPAARGWPRPQAGRRCAAGSVVRVRPRVSRGITDLLARPRSSGLSPALARGRSSRSLTR